MAGEIKGFTGVDDPYEAPEKPELIIDTESLTPDAAAERILSYLEQNGYLAP
jgi:adenylylsulfate kinase-like enzyme